MAAYGSTGGQAAPGGAAPSRGSSGPKAAAAPRGPARPGRGTPSRPSGPGRGGARGSTAPKQATQTFLWQRPMSDQQIKSMAGTIADAQTTGPLDQLARQIARNNQQTSQSQTNTAGLFGQLGGQVQESNRQIGQISGNLNSQLQGIGQDTQATIAKAFTPGAELADLQARGLGGGGTEALKAEGARQQGFAGQNADAFRSFGATQGANAQTLGAQNLGSFATRGQEMLGAIGRAGQLANRPLSDKQAGLIANRGNLFAKAVGQLTDNERKYGLANAQQGIKAYTAQTDATVKQQNAATNVKNAGTRAAQAGVAAGNLAERVRHDHALELSAQRKIGQGHGSQLTPNERLTVQRKVGASLQSGRAAFGLVGHKDPKGTGPGGTITDADIVTNMEHHGYSPAVIAAARQLAQTGSVQPDIYQALVKQAGGDPRNLPAINRGHRAGSSIF